MRDLTKHPFHGVIKEYQNWVVLFREKQVTIGSVIIMSKQLEADSLGEVSAEAWAEFALVCKETEALITGLFGAEKFNYLALMMIDPEVHFHVIPRYSKTVLFEGDEYIDPDWPLATQRVAMKLSQTQRDSIQKALTSTH